MQFNVMTRTHAWQFTLKHRAKCHSTISWIMSGYFPTTGFKATVCASTGDWLVDWLIDWSIDWLLYDTSAQKGYYCQETLPDGLTLIPLSATWDVTVTDTVAASYLNATSCTAGSVAKAVASRKEEKYAGISSNYLFFSHLLLKLSGL